jgi:hypothetical protein
MKLKDLEKGTYIFTFKKLQRSIKIEIIQGVYWESEDYILKGDTLIKTTPKKTFKRITHYEVKDAEESKQNTDLKQIKFKVDGARENLRVHVFASNVLFNNPRWMIYSMGYLSSYLNRVMFKLSKFENEYLNNKKLSDELRYCYFVQMQRNKNLSKGGDSKLSKSFFGTTLERPSLLFHKRYFCDTYFDTEYGGQEQGYQKFIPITSNQFAYAGAAKYGASKMMKSCLPMSGNSGPVAYYNSLESYVPTNFSSYFNFCDTPPFVVTNLKEKDGFYSLNINTKIYTNLTILAVDSTGGTQKIIDIEHDNSNLPQIKRRKIELDKPLSSSENYHETRNTVCLKPNEKHSIEDITSVEYQTIDSLNKVNRVLQELLTLKHQENSSFASSSWLFNWPNFDSEMKNKKYSKFMCNELNFFLYFKDEKYFNSTIKPTISSKIEKTLIDYFLLEEYKKVTEYAHVSNFDSLNALEQCLLISVINMSDPTSAKLLADQFINKAKLTETKTAKKHHKFDTVLLMKILESDDLDGEGDDEELKVSTTLTSKVASKKKSKKKEIKRQRSMSNSSNSSVEDFQWANYNKAESDEDANNEGEGYSEGEGYGGGGGEIELSYCNDDMEYQNYAEEE